MIHIGLECGRGVTETEEHDNMFIKAGLSYESGFPSIIRVNIDIISISLSDIDLCEILGRVEFVEERGN